MIVYRISKGRYADDLSGKGAELWGGRWNSAGTPMLYTSSNRALALLESLVHLPVGLAPVDHRLVTIEFPNTVKIGELSVEDLPPDWKMDPPGHLTQIVGDHFAADRQYLALQVLSSIVGDYNFALNPRHPEFSSVKVIAVEPFVFDERLVRLLGASS
jgi:RES domain-containing protein